MSNMIRYSHLLCLQHAPQSCVSWGAILLGKGVTVRDPSIYYVYLLLAKKHLSRKDDNAKTVDRRLAASFEDLPKKSSMAGVRPWEIVLLKASVKQLQNMN